MKNIKRCPVRFQAHLGELPQQCALPKDHKGKHLVNTPGGRFPGSNLDNPGRPGGFVGLWMGYSFASFLLGGITVLFGIGWNRDILTDFSMTADLALGILGGLSAGSLFIGAVLAYLNR